MQHRWNFESGKSLTFGSSSKRSWMILEEILNKIWKGLKEVTGESKGNREEFVASGWIKQYPYNAVSEKLAIMWTIKRVPN